MKITWIVCDDGWFGSYREFRATVYLPRGPLGMSHWSVYCGDKRGGSGGTSSVAAAVQCKPIPTPKPRPAYTRQQRLKESFEALAKQPTSVSFLRSETIYQRLNFGRYLP